MGFRSFKITPTLSRYIATNYLINLALLFLALLFIIYLFDMVELIRRASKRDDVPFGLVMQMGLLKLPEVAQVIAPFAVLFGAMFTFWQLTRRYELIVVRAAGFSVWQFLGPVLLVAFTIGALQVTMINPMGALLLGKYEQLENIHLKRNKNEIAVFKEGLWLRQSMEDEPGYTVIHAGRLDQKNWALRDVTVLRFSADDGLEQRIDADEARLADRSWLMTNAALQTDAPEPETLAEYKLPTDLTPQDIEDSFGSPDSMSFWQLPGHIQTLEAAGFDATRLRVHYHTLLAQPLLFVAMILLAASVSMRPPRMRGTLVLISLGIAIGFATFFLSSFLQALGVSRQIPVFLSAWSPALICFLMGITMMLNFEDG
ncbi:MAG: LPS export ABC transporter permease LptG [Alphaproteobacteria bacterium]|nr:LPS export ABC transporter permease LptG [Alphaproteobacteria bacterium]MCD8571418.1 LPS export ABC transporter permease LptG [Alphaproteobacteria bacterium]